MAPSPEYTENQQVIMRSLDHEFTRRLMVHKPMRADDIYDQEQPPPVPAKKMVNPCLHSKEKLDLHKELLFNQKHGKNVLNRKTELQKVMTKFQDEHQRKEIEQERANKQSLFERKLQQQADKIKQCEQSKNLKKDNLSETQDGGDAVPEFLRVYAKVKAKQLITEGSLP